MANLYRELKLTTNGRVIENDPWNQHIMMFIDSISYGTHELSDYQVDSEETIDVHSFFTIVEIMLKGSTPTTNIDEDEQCSQVRLEKIEEETLEADFNIPPGTLKEIGCELICGDLNPKIAKEKTLSILKKLSNYSWQTKAVLTLAAFTTTFGDLWHNRLSESSDLMKKRSHEVIQLKDLLNADFQLIETILDYLEMPCKFGREPFQYSTFWIIMTIIACATKLNILITSDEDRPCDISPHSKIIQYIINMFTEQFKGCQVLGKEEFDHYRMLLEFFQHPNDTEEVFKALFSTKGYMPPLICGPEKKEVAIDVLRGQKILMLISGLDISDKDISGVTDYYKTETETEETISMYKIVWVPTEEQWTDQHDEKFLTMQSKLSWYSLHPATIAVTPGIKFIKHEWYKEATPIVVWISPETILRGCTKVKSLYQVQLKAEDNRPRNSMNVFRSEEKYKFYYGGKDKDWVQRFKEKATALTKDPIIKMAKTSIELQYVPGSSSGGESSNGKRIWTAIQSSFSHKNNVPKEIMEKLLPNKNEVSWVVLFKDSDIVMVGHGAAIIKVFEELDKWKQNVREKGFRVAFKEYHRKVLSNII